MITQIGFYDAYCDVKLLKVINHPVIHDNNCFIFYPILFFSFYLSWLEDGYDMFWHLYYALTLNAITNSNNNDNISLCGRKKNVNFPKLVTSFNFQLALN